MTGPLHPLVSLPLHGDVASVSARLVDHLDDLVAEATADAIATLAPLARAWGLRPSALPTVHAQPTVTDELGVAVVGWRGDEEATAWPAVSGRLLVDTHPGAARLVFLADRSPAAELRTGRLDRLHRRRLTDVAVRRTLQQLARALSQPPAPRAGPAGPTLGRFDRSPAFVHATVVADLPPAALADGIAADPTELARRATATVVERMASDLVPGRFRTVAAPDVTARRTAPGELGASRIGWRGDEEATGWPALSWTLVVEPWRDGSRLALLSSREPAYDGSVNRFDKQPRDRVLRRVGAELATALRAELAPVASATAATAVTTRQLAATSPLSSRPSSTDPRPERSV
jgi:hypothetical protein